MADASKVRGLLHAYLFHWTPERAIWIGGHTLSWDARCAGIYAGFGLAAVWQLAAGWRAWRVPSFRVLVVAGLFALPLFADVLSVASGLRLPSNNARFLTGLLFGAVLSIALLPTVLSLARLSDGQAREGILYFAPISVVLGAAFLLKEWDHRIAFVSLEALSYAGFFALVALLAAGVYLVFQHGRSQ